MLRSRVAATSNYESYSHCHHSLESTYQQERPYYHVKKHRLSSIYNQIQQTSIIPQNSCFHVKYNPSQ